MPSVYISPSTEEEQQIINKSNSKFRDNAVTVTIILGYRDNIEDATWVINNIDTIGRNLAMSLAEYLKVPFVDKTSIDKNWGD